MSPITVEVMPPFTALRSATMVPCMWQHLHGSICLRLLAGNQLSAATASVDCQAHIFAQTYAIAAAKASVAGKCHGKDGKVGAHAAITAKVEALIYDKSKCTEKKKSKGNAKAKTKSNVFTVRSRRPARGIPADADTSTTMGIAIAVACALGIALSGIIHGVISSICCGQQMQLWFLRGLCAYWSTGYESDHSLCGQQQACLSAMQSDVNQAIVCKPSPARGTGDLSPTVVRGVCGYACRGRSSCTRRARSPTRRPRRARSPTRRAAATSKHALQRACALRAARPPVRQLLSASTGSQRKGCRLGKSRCCGLNSIDTDQSQRVPASSSSAADCRQLKPFQLQASCCAKLMHASLMWPCMVSIVATSRPSRWWLW